MSAQRTSTNLRPNRISGFDPTPLWNHVQVISTTPGNGGGGNRVWTCNYCNKKVTGSYSKVKVHLLKLSGQGVKSCKAISDEEYLQVKKEYDEAEANKAREARDRLQKKEYIAPLGVYSDLVEYRRRVIEGSELLERNQFFKTEENILALPENDMVQRIKFEPVVLRNNVEKASNEHQTKKEVVKEVSLENNVSIGYSARNVDFPFQEDCPNIEIEEDGENKVKGRGEQEETIIEMCANVNKTTPCTPASRAPTPKELLERRILKKTNGANSSLSFLPTKSPDTNFEPLVGGKRKFQIEVNPNFCDFKEGTSSIKPDLNQFYFPAAREYLSKLRAVDVLAESAAYNIQSLQGTLAVKEYLEELEAKLEAAKVTEEIYKEKSRADAKTISMMRKRIKELEDYGKKKKDEVLDCAGYYTFKTKAELMKEFLDGNTDKWDPQKDIKNWEENFADMAPPGVEENFDLFSEEDVC